MDLDRQHVRISEFAATLGYALVPSTGKSRDSTRTIDLDRHLVDVLRRQQRRQADERAQAMDYAVTDYVFTKQLGGSCHPQTISKLLARLSVEVELPRLTAHGLRHTSATLMLASGIPPKVAPNARWASSDQAVWPIQACVPRGRCQRVIHMQRQGASYMRPLSWNLQEVRKW